MRFASLIFAAFLVAPVMAAATWAQPASPGPVPALADGLAVCKAMFADRHPLPPDFSKDIDFNRPAGEVLLERGKLAGLKPPSFDELSAAGWVWPSMQREPMRNVMVIKSGSWGRISLALTGTNCSVSLSAPDRRLPDGPELIAAAETWISQTYPAAVRDEPTTSPPRDYRGEPRAVTRTTWRAPDTIRVSLSVGHVGTDTRPESFYLSVSYSPHLPRPASPAPPPPT